MADRVSISIAIGGRVSADDFAVLAEIIAAEDLATEWDGPTFEPAHREVGGALSLFAHQVAWGRVEPLESWCTEHGLPFVRWSGSYPGEWSAERIVFRGEGEPDSYLVDESDRVVVDRHIVVDRGSVEALLAYFAEAEFPVPPLVVEGDPEPIASAAQEGSDRHG